MFSVSCCKFRVTWTRFVCGPGKAPRWKTGFQDSSSYLSVYEPPLFSWADSLSQGVTRRAEYTFIYLSIYLSIYSSIYLSIYICIESQICICIYICIFRSLNLSISDFLSICILTTSVSWADSLSHGVAGGAAPAARAQDNRFRGAHGQEAAARPWETETLGAVALRGGP